jgi:hypothetical protein
MTLPRSNQDWISGIVGEGLVIVGDPRMKEPAVLVRDPRNVLTPLDSMTGRLRDLNGVGQASCRRVGGEAGGAMLAYGREGMRWSLVSRCRRSIPLFRIRRVSTMHCSAARTITRRTGRLSAGSWKPLLRCGTQRGPTVRSCSGRCGSWRARRVSADHRCRHRHPVGGERARGGGAGRAGYAGGVRGQ